MLLAKRSECARFVWPQAQTHQRLAAVEHRAMLLAKGDKSNYRPPEGNAHGRRYARGRRSELASHRPTDDRSPEAATSLQLYQLKALVEGMLANPRCGIAARASLHLGQAANMKDPLRGGAGRRDADRQGEQAPYERPPEPVTAAANLREFQRGDTVGADHSDGRGTTVVIVRINQHIATIGTGTADG